jgi:ferritin
LKVHSGEETQHGMRLYQFLIDRGGRVELEAIDKPPVDFGKPLEVFEKALEHEKKVTASINDLYETALGEKDYPAQVELQWFINEQVEEENTFDEIVQQLKLAGDKPQVLLMLDRQLAQRGAAPEGGE